MYEELSDISEATGKTVQSITYASFGDQMIVAFEDETFIVFGIERGYESCDDEVMRRELVLEDFGRNVLIESGIIAREELDQRREERVKAMRRGREDAERRQLARLKAKFEGGEG